MKPLLVGESPSRSGDRYWQFPLSGAVAQTLCQFAGIPPQSEGSRYGKWTWALYEHFDCVNVVERYPGGGWTSDVARRAAVHLREVMQEASEPYEVVVLLGRHAQQAYVDMQTPALTPVEDVDFYRWVIGNESPTGRRHVIVLPHPSALNRTYNDGSARQKAGRYLREAIVKAAELYETRL